MSLMRGKKTSPVTNRWSVMSYLIWSNEHRAWWKPNQRGHTTRTDKAGRFTSFEARSIVMNANRFQKPDETPNEIMVEAPSRDQIELDMAYPDR